MQSQGVLIEKYIEKFDADAQVLNDIFTGDRARRMYEFSSTGQQ